MRSSRLKHIIVGLAFILVQLLIFQFLTVFGATADIVLVFIAWISIRYQRYEVLLFAAGLGFFQDMFFDTWGLNMFAKTITFFLIYNFLNRNSELRLLVWQAFGYLLGIALIHNLFFLIFASFLDVYSSTYSPIIILLISSLYTATIGTLLFVLKGDSN